MPTLSEELDIFVFTAVNRRAQENLLRSIENPIQAESTAFEGFEELSEDLRNELGWITDTAGGFYAWGAEPRGHAGSTWGKMARGDYVLAYYAKGFHYVARVLATIHEPTLATSIWGTNENTGNTWEYMYFLTKPVKIAASVDWMADAAPFPITDQQPRLREDSEPATCLLSGVSQTVQRVEKLLRALF